MNQEMEKRYCILENIKFLQDFVNVNLKWLCFCTSNSKDDCRTHLLSLAFKKLRAGNKNFEKNKGFFMLCN